MSTIWSKLTDIELELVISSFDYKSVLTKLKQKEGYQDWEESAKQRFNQQFSLKNHAIPSLFSSLNDATSLIPMSFASLLGVTTLSVVSLGVFTAITAAAMLAVGIFFYIRAYRNRKDTNRQNYKRFVHLEAVIAACEERNTRSTVIVNETPRPEFNCDDFKFENKDVFGTLTDALGSGVLTFSMLFSTYYLCAAMVILGFGVAAASSIMLGPIGIGIALGACALIGAVYTYHCYKSNVNENKVEKLNKFLERRLEHEHAQHIEVMHFDPDLRSHSSDKHSSQRTNDQIRNLQHYRARRLGTGGGKLFSSPRATTAEISTPRSRL